MQNEVKMLASSGNARAIQSTKTEEYCKQAELLKNYAERRRINKSGAIIRSIFSRRSRFSELPIDKLEAFATDSQPDRVKNALLAQSIKENGMVLPVLVFFDNDGLYKLIDGNRRYSVAKELGYKRISAFILPCDRTTALLIRASFVHLSDFNDCFAASSRIASLFEDGYAPDSYARGLLLISNYRMELLKKYNAITVSEVLLMRRMSFDKIISMLSEIDNIAVRTRIILAINDYFDEFAKNSFDIIEKGEAVKSNKDMLVIKDIRFLYNSIEKLVHKLYKNKNEVTITTAEDEREYTIAIKIPRRDR